MFWLPGDQGRGWMAGRLTIPTGSTYQLRFEAQVGSSYLSDIAIDDVTIDIGKCAHPGNISVVVAGFAISVHGIYWIYILLRCLCNGLAAEKV